MEFTQIPQRDKARDLSPGDFRPSTIDVVYEIANRSTPSIHTLGRVPTGYVVVGSSVAVPEHTAEDKNKWTADRIYTRSVANAGTAKLEVR
jgi:hypothetical protein